MSTKLGKENHNSILHWNTSCYQTRRQPCLPVVDAAAIKDSSWKHIFSTPVMTRFFLNLKRKCFLIEMDSPLSANILSSVTQLCVLVFILGLGYRLHFMLFTHTLPIHSKHISVLKWERLEIFHLILPVTCRFQDTTSRNFKVALLCTKNKGKEAYLIKSLKRPISYRSNKKAKRYFCSAVKRLKLVIFMPSIYLFSNFYRWWVTSY